MRTYGLSGSGIDVDQMVKDMMKARRASFDKVWQQKTQTEWQKKDFNTMYTLSQDFRSSTIFNFRKTSSYMPKQVTSSNDTVLSATANADAANVSHSVVVDQLADGVKLSSSDKINGSGTLFTQFGYTTADSPLEFNINGEMVSVTLTDTTTINDVVSAINKSDAGVKANYDATLDRFYLYSNKAGSSSTINFAGSSSKGLDFLNNKLKLGEQNSTVTSFGMTSKDNLGLTSTEFTIETLGSKFSITQAFTLNITQGSTTTPISVTPTNTLSEVLGAINATVGSPVASYDANTGKVTLQADPGNSSSIFSITGANNVGTEFLINTLKLGQIGQDAKIQLDGVELTQASNNFSISGVTYNLKSVSSNPININIQPDIEKTIANVKEFVENYNTFIGAINTEINETKYREFLPLTDEQKTDMKENDIKAWEEKAHSGLLRRDPALSDLVYKLRSSFSTPVSGLAGDYNSAASIGIKTGSYITDDGELSNEFTNNGKLYVNEDELREALLLDPDIVYKIFGSSGETNEANGVANRLYDQMYTSINKLKDQAGYPGITDSNSFLAKKLDNYNEQLSNMERRLQDTENRYYKQFDAMEIALNKLNQQNGWLLQQFSGS